MTRLRVAVIGVGHLGKEHARILASLPDVELVGVVDQRPAQAAQVAERCGTRPHTDHTALLSQVDAAVIAVPTQFHHAVAVDFLQRGIPLLIEKPLAPDLEQANDLTALAEKKGIPLQIGHIERYNPAFEELQRRPLRPRFISAERLGGYTGRSIDIGVVLDLMIHDLDLIQALVGAPLRSVEALGVSVLGGHEDVAQARLTFADGCVAQVAASRVHPVAQRRMQVWGAEGFAGVDFAKRHLTLMQPAAHLRGGQFDARRLDGAELATFRNDLFGKHVETLDLDCAGGDQLTLELQEFLRCVRTGARPRVDGVAGREAIALACAVLDSLRAHAWEGDVDGPVGPTQLPAARGVLFVPTVPGIAA
jgi:predicted dehydrogenase